MSTASSTVPDVSQLFQNAAAAGDLSPGSAKALQALDIGNAIQAALGTPALAVTASETLLVNLLIDDSGSIRFVQGNTEAVRDGHNMVIEALGGSKQKDGVLVHTRFLNAGLHGAGYGMFPYAPIGQAVKLDSKNYNPEHGTPLYDATVNMLGTVIAKAEEFKSMGVPVRSVTCIVSDGNDQHSVKQNAMACQRIVHDMLKSESHIIIAMGVDDGSTDFRIVFTGMGIPDKFILTPKNTPSEIRKAFAVVSQSTLQASQNANAFSKTAQGGLGGFATP